MIAETLRYWAFALGLALPAITVADLPTEQRNAPLQSVHRRKADVFASNKFGIFRADLKSRRWNKLEVPEGMPVGGEFASVPKESTLLLYVVSERHRASDGNQKYGIYASRNDGGTWELLSVNHDYGSVLLLLNGALFAVTNPSNRDGPSRVHVSQDMGQTWRDITGESFGGIYGIFPDPDHPTQICLRVSSIRSYVLQADDEQYLWKPTREWEWHPERYQTESFFDRNYSTQTTGYMLPATLDNYFQYGFGDRTAIPSFDLSPDTPRIAVPRGVAVRIPVTIRFLEDAAVQNWFWEDRRAKGYLDPEPTPTTVTLIDNASTSGLWGIRVNFKGQRTAKRAKVSDDIYNAKDRDAERQKILRETVWKEIQLNASKPYSRQLDLAQLHDFAEAGTYKVQLTYDNGWLAERGKGHWVGSFSSPVFEVVVAGDE